MSNNLLSRLRSMAGSAQRRPEAAGAADTRHPEISVGPSSITFTVDDVIPASSRLATCQPLDAVRALLDAPPDSFDRGASQESPTRGRVEASWSSTLACVEGIAHHPLIAATHLAFSQHRPLVFSPDVIWVTIVQALDSTFS